MSQTPEELVTNPETTSAELERIRDQIFEYVSADSEVNNKEGDKDRQLVERTMRAWVLVIEMTSGFRPLMSNFTDKDKDPFVAALARIPENTFLRYWDELAERMDPMDPEVTYEDFLNKGIEEFLDIDGNFINALRSIKALEDIPDGEEKTRAKLAIIGSLFSYAPSLKRVLSVQELLRVGDWLSRTMRNSNLRLVEKRYERPDIEELYGISPYSLVAVRGGRKEHPDTQWFLGKDTLQSDQGRRRLFQGFHMEEIPKSYLYDTTRRLQVGSISGYAFYNYESTEFKYIRQKVKELLKRTLSEDLQEQVREFEEQGGEASLFALIELARRTDNWSRRWRTAIQDETEIDSRALAYLHKAIIQEMKDPSFSDLTNTFRGSDWGVGTPISPYVRKR